MVNEKTNKTPHNCPGIRDILFRMLTSENSLISFMEAIKYQFEDKHVDYNTEMI
jgi:hypothetical protein